TAGPDTRPISWAIHPGEILREEFLKPLHLSAYALAKPLRIPAPHQRHRPWSTAGSRRIRPSAWRVFFGTREQFWTNLQASYDVRRARLALKSELRKIRPLAAGSAAWDWPNPRNSGKIQVLPSLSEGLSSHGTYL